jgi:Ferritin-like domain
MSDAFDLVYRSVEEQHADKPASTRRAFVAGAASTLGGLGLLALPGAAAAAGAVKGANDPQTILNVAATAEVLATIVNTVGWERGLGVDRVTQHNIKAAAREELVHYQVLVASGGKPVTKKIWVSDGVFASRTGLLNALQVGDQIFVNAYLIATETFGNAGNGALAVTAAEFMGVEAVHRALARQSLGQLGNDRVFCKYYQREEAGGAPNRGQLGFKNILDAVSQLEAAGFGFGAEGASPGRFYNFEEISKRTPTDGDLNTFRPAS